MKKIFLFSILYGATIFSALLFSQEEALNMENVLPEKTGFTAMTEDGRKVIYNKKSSQIMKGGIMEIKKSAQIASLLAKLLADEYVLFTKTYKFHWNVKSTHFGALHALFREQYEQLADIVDGTAERMLQIGHNAPATLKEFLQETRLDEEPGKFPTDSEMLFILAQNHNQVIGYIRELIDITVELDDAGTNNFLAERLEMHEKMAWMLRASLVE